MEEAEVWWLGVLLYTYIYIDRCGVILLTKEKWLGMIHPKRDDLLKAVIVDALSEMHHCRYDRQP